MCRMWAWHMSMVMRETSMALFNVCHILQHTRRLFMYVSDVISRALCTPIYIMSHHRHNMILVNDVMQRMWRHMRYGTSANDVVWCHVCHLTSINQSINQSIKLLLRQYPQRSQAQWGDSQISVQHQNRGNSSVTSTGHGEWRYLWGKGQIKEMCLQIFLEGSNWNGWTDRQREVVPKRRDTRVKGSSTSIGFDPRDWQTIIVVWSQWTGRNRCGKDGMKINRLFFTQGFVGQQIDLKSILNLTGNQWRERSSGILRVNGGDPVTRRASWFCTRWSLVRSMSAIPYKSELQIARRPDTRAVASNLALSRSRWRRIRRRSRIW